jgi:hypothetical protein
VSFRRRLALRNRFAYFSDSAAGAFILNVTYGYNIEPHGEDPLVRLANHALKQFSEATVPGAWLVDLIPACKFPVF